MGNLHSRGREDKMTPKTCRYTASRIRKDDVLYGPIHGCSPSGNETLCGHEIDENWYIVTTKYDGKITCQKCLRLLAVAE